MSSSRAQGGLRAIVLLRVSRCLVEIYLEFDYVPNISQFFRKRNALVKRESLLRRLSDSPETVFSIRISDQRGIVLLSMVSYRIHTITRTR